MLTTQESSGGTAKYGGGGKTYQERSAQNYWRHAEKTGIAALLKTQEPTVRILVAELLGIWQQKCNTRLA